MNKENDHYIFGDITNFEKAFPKINNMKIRITESVGNNIINKINIDKTKFRETIKCSKFGCFQGGVEIGSILREMIYEKLEKKEDSFICEGKIGSPKGKIIHGMAHVGTNLSIRF